MSPAHWVRGRELLRGGPGSVGQGSPGSLTPSPSPPQSLPHEAGLPLAEGEPGTFLPQAQNPQAQNPQKNPQSSLGVIPLSRVPYAFPSTLLLFSFYLIFSFFAQ